jgi:hypothetical protein
LALTAPVLALVSESELYGQIIGAHSRGGTRLFRQQSLLAWAGKVLHRTETTITLLYPHAVKFGIPGMADLGGLTAVQVTPAMIGRTLGVYLACEVKAGRARPTAEQAAFLEMVQHLGGRAGVARSVEDAGAIIRGEALD